MESCAKVFFGLFVVLLACLWCFWRRARLWCFWPGFGLGLWLRLRLRRRAPSLFVVLLEALWQSRATTAMLIGLADCCGTSDDDTRFLLK